MKRIQILVFDGFDELDALAPFEVLGAASAGGDNSVELVTGCLQEEVVAAHGLHLRTFTILDPENPPDMLVVAGGGWNSRAPQGVRWEYERGLLPELIAACYRAGTLVASVCTGALLLAKAGLLVNRPASTHYAAREDLRGLGVIVRSERVVDDGDILTAGGVTSGLDLAFHLVERLYGSDLADQLAERMEYDRRGPIHITGRGFQPEFMSDRYNT